MKIGAILYNASVFGFVLGMTITIATFRPIEPNLYIAGIEVAVGSVTLVVAAVKIGRAVI